MIPLALLYFSILQIYACGEEGGCKDGTVWISHTTIAEITSGRYVAVLAQDTAPHKVQHVEQEQETEEEEDNDSDDYHIVAVSDEFIVTPPATFCNVQTHRQLQSANMAQVILDARSDIMSLMASNPTLPGRYLRLIFHDCVGGRCDGCINMVRFVTSSVGSVSKSTKCSSRHSYITFSFYGFLSSFTQTIHVL